MTGKVQVADIFAYLADQTAAAAAAKRVVKEKKKATSVVCFILGTEATERRGGLYFTF